MPFSLCLLAACVLNGDVPQLDYERTFDLEPGDVRSVALDALSSAITVRAVVKSPGVPVNVYLVLEQDREAAVASVLKRQRPAKLLASKEKTEAATLEAAIPAKTGFGIVIAPVEARKARVTIVVEGKLK